MEPIGDYENVQLLWLREQTFILKSSFGVASGMQLYDVANAISRLEYAVKEERNRIRAGRPWNPKEGR